MTQTASSNLPVHNRETLGSIYQKQFGNFPLNVSNKSQSPVKTNNGPGAAYVLKK